MCIYYGAGSQLLNLPMPCLPRYLTSMGDGEIREYGSGRVYNDLGYDEVVTVGIWQ
jgi:hypothetical protein